MKASRQAVWLASLCLFLASVAAGGQGIDEYTLEAAYRGYLRQQVGTVEGTQANFIGQSVFSDLTRALSVSYGAKPYELSILADPFGEREFGRGGEGVC